MGTVGKVSIDLEAQHAKFTKGCEEAQKDVHNLSESITSGLETIRTAFELMAVAEVVSKLAEWSKETIEAAINSKHLADSLGITAGQMSHLEAAAKVAHISVEQMDGGLQKLAKNLGGAEDGGKKVTAALGELGLSMNDLKGKNLDETFSTIAQKISEISDPAKRAADEVTIFGKSGQQLDPLLRQGAAGIAAAKAKADELGIALSDVDSAKLIAAGEQMEEVSHKIEGIKNQAVIALAPVLSEIANDVLKIIPPADKMRAAFMEGFRDVAIAIGWIVDGFDELRAVDLAMAATATGAVELILTAFRKLAEAIVWTKNKLFGGDTKVPQWMTSAVDGADIMRKQFEKDSMDAFHSPSAHKAAAEFFDNIQDKANQAARAVASSNPVQVIGEQVAATEDKVGKMIDKMKKEVEEFGMTKEQKAVNEVKDAGGSPAQVAEAIFLQTKMSFMEKMKKMAEEEQKARKTMAEDAQRMIEDSESPLEKYQEKLKKIQDFVDAGLMTQHQADEAREKALDDMNKKDKEKKKKTHEHDTTTMVERRFDFRVPMVRHDPHKDKVAKLHEQTNHHLATIVRNTSTKPKGSHI